MTITANTEILEGKRFAFGKNWSRFLKTLSEERIQEAEKSLRDMLDVSDLQGKDFLDIGSGSGLFSLAARRLGARVHSFDFDPQSVACTRRLQERFFPHDTQWVIEQGSVLDKDFLERLQKADIVYSWGVLHHTGAMWEALENASQLVKPDGKIFIAIYNDEGRSSKRWAMLKKTYNKNRNLRPLILAAATIRMWGPAIIRDLLKGKPMSSWKNYKSSRGMSAWYDVIDWVGGYPFEVASPGTIFDFHYKRGFTLTNMITRQGYGCNEFVFTKNRN